MIASMVARTALVLVFAISLAIPAAGALERREIEAVVGVLEKLTSETGNTVYYDEDAAEEWFETDEEMSELIPAAGFSRRSWKTAFDQTITGFIASVPEAEFDEMIEEFIDKVAEAGKLTPAQKREAAIALRAEMGRLDEVREQGAPYRDLVGPYGPRLRKLVFSR